MSAAGGLGTVTESFCLGNHLRVARQFPSCSSNKAFVRARRCAKPFPRIKAFRGIPLRSVYSVATLFMLLFKCGRAGPPLASLASG